MNGVLGQGFLSRPLNFQNLMINKAREEDVTRTMCKKRLS